MINPLLAILLSLCWLPRRSQTRGFRHPPPNVAKTRCSGFACSVSVTCRTLRSASRLAATEGDRVVGRPRFERLSSIETLSKSPSREDWRISANKLVFMEVPKCLFTSAARPRMVKSDGFPAWSRDCTHLIFFMVSEVTVYFRLGRPPSPSTRRVSCSVLLTLPLLASAPVHLEKISPLPHMMKNSGFQHTTSENHKSSLSD